MAAVAALAVAVNHEFASTLRDLVHQIENLTRETEQLAQQVLQSRRDVLSLRAVLAALLCARISMTDTVLVEYISGAERLRYMLCTNLRTF